MTTSPRQTFALPYWWRPATRPTGRRRVISRSPISPRPSSTLRPCARPKTQPEATALMCACAWRVRGHQLLSRLGLTQGSMLHALLSRNLVVHKRVSKTVNRTENGQKRRRILLLYSSTVSIVYLQYIYSISTTRAIFSSVYFLVPQAQTYRTGTVHTACGTNYLRCSPTALYA